MIIDKLLYEDIRSEVFLNKNNIVFRRKGDKPDYYHLVINVEAFKEIVKKLEEKE